MSEAARMIGFGGSVFALIGVQMAFLPALYADRGLSPTGIGVVMGVATALRLFTGPFGGRLADQWGATWPVLLLATAGALASALLLPVGGAVLISIATILLAGCAAPLVPLWEAQTLRAAAEGRLDYGRVRAAGSAAFVAGAVGAGMAVDAVGAGVVAWLMPGLIGLALIALFAVPREARPAHLSGARTPLLADRGFRRLLLVSGLIQGSHAAYYSFGTLHWQAAGHSGGTVGLLWGWGVVAEVGLFLAARRITLAPASLVMLAAVGGVLRWSITASTTWLPALVAAQTLHAVTFALMHLAAMRWLGVNLPPARAGGAQSILAAWGANAWIGAFTLASGPIFAAWGGGLWWVMAALCALALPLARKL